MPSSSVVTLSNILDGQLFPKKKSHAEARPAKIVDTQNVPANADVMNRILVLEKQLTAARDELKEFTTRYDLFINNINENQQSMLGILSAHMDRNNAKEDELTSLIDETLSLKIESIKKELTKNLKLLVKETQSQQYTTLHKEIDDTFNKRVGTENLRLWKQETSSAVFTRISQLKEEIKKELLNDLSTFQAKKR